MQTRLGINGAVLMLTAGLSVQTAAACPRESVTATVEKWASVFAENNPDTIVALYSKDAGLVGHAFTHGTIGSGRAEGLLRGCLPGAA
jgi:hypothetical protein